MSQSTKILKELMKLTKDKTTLKEIEKMIDKILIDDFDEDPPKPKLAKKVLICKGCNKILAKYYGIKNTRCLCKTCYKIMKLKE